jgi:hypothetical protein
MHRTPLITAAFGAALLLGAAAGVAGPADQNTGTVLAQAQQTTPQGTPSQGTNLGTPMTQPQPGGGVAAGPGAPTSAAPAAPGSAPADAATQGRGAPQPGSAAAPPQGRATGSSQLGPTGAIRPGSQGGEPGTGGSQSNSTP